MNINDKLSSNPLAIANAFISYFLSIAEKLIIINFHENNTINNKDPITNLSTTESQSVFFFNKTKKHYYV